MKHQQNSNISKRVKLCIWIVIAGLLLSGVTAFPLEAELTWLVKNMPNGQPEVNAWLNKVYLAVKDTNVRYPFISYGTDWLAFAHLMLAILFFGPLRNPVKNIWVVQFGIIAALFIFPLAFIAGRIRGVPFFWQCIDCSFGVVTLAILLPCHKWIKKMEAMA